MADVQLTVTIPEEYVTRVQTALEASESLETTIMLNEVEPRIAVGSCVFVIPEKGALTIREYAETIVRLFMKSLVEIQEDDDFAAQYQADIEAVVRQKPVIPADLLT